VVWTVVLKSEVPKHALDDLSRREARGVEHDRSTRPDQRPDLSEPVEPIAGCKLPGDCRKGWRAALQASQLHLPAPRPHPGVRGQEKLVARLRKHHGTRITPFHDERIGSGELPLEADQRSPNRRMLGDHGCGIGDPFSPDLTGDIASVQDHPDGVFPDLVQVKAQRLGHADQMSDVVGIDPL